jgi:hypothetical protein
MEWIKVSDRLPYKGLRVLVCTESGHLEVCFLLYEEDWYSDSSGRSMEAMAYTITHWMLLPEPPKE